MVVGHEYIGEIVAISQEVKGFNIGDRVSGKGILFAVIVVIAVVGVHTYAVIPFGVGVNRPGCFAEYLVIPALMHLKFLTIFG